MNLNDYKSISFDQLHKMSLTNHKKYSQNVWTEKLLVDYPHLKTMTLVLQHLIYIPGGGIRTSVYCGKGFPTIYQDLTFEQWNSLSKIKI
jgi:hypothetical protein